jgi:hypothetical protein
MATSRLVLPIPGGVAPDASGSGNASARPEKVVSSGTQTTNTPKASYVHLLYDPSTDQHWMWHFILPGDYSSGGTLRLKWGQKGTSAGNVVWKGGQVSATDSSTDMDAAVFTAADVSSADAAPTTTEQVTTSTIALTATGMSASREIVVFIGRDADNGSDTCAADATLVGVTLEYTS